MTQSLTVSIGQHSDRGRKPTNQDFHGASVPGEPQLGAKGVAVALADGISSSAVSQDASRAAVSGFLDDYYCTPDAWSVKRSALQVLAATNSWLHSQTRRSPYRYERDRGYVCTFDALVLKSNTAHLFHVGDGRIYRLRGETLELLTEDHRYWVSSEESHLTRALGIDARLDVDYRAHALEAGDVFLLATDGVYESVDPGVLVRTLLARRDDLDSAACALVEAALAQGSEDNLTVQIVRVDALPDPEAGELTRDLGGLPFPPELSARMAFDGFRIVRPIHASHRSHAWLAVDIESGEQVVIKTPSTEHRDDPAWLERFLLEEWIARRIDNPHVMKPCAVTRRRNFQYVVMEYIEGQTLAQWMRDHAAAHRTGPDLATVRDLVGQIARGLMAFHRLEMVHQDLRPENVMIDATGTVKIIDFGATRVAGIVEMGDTRADEAILGTEQYAAPEYFLGESGTPASDLYSLGVIAYQLLTGQLPYGAAVARTRNRTEQARLVYAPVRDGVRNLPVWVDEALRRAVHPDPARRYAELSEFLYDLSHPNPDYLRRSKPPLIERHPVRFWQTTSLLLGVALCVALYRLHLLGAVH